MFEWLPVIATLLGAALAGFISIIVQLIANRHARQNHLDDLSEERARWAAEHELQKIQSLYAAIENLADAVQWFRIAEAWDLTSSSSDIARPDWAPDSGDAQLAMDKSWQAVSYELPFLDDTFREKFEAATTYRREYNRAELNEERIEALQELERSLYSFKRELGVRYRHIVETRRAGEDVRPGG